MWSDSQKWKERRAQGKHGVVTFDVQCGCCGRLLAEDVGCDEMDKVGLHTMNPMDIFCNHACLRAKQNQTGIGYQTYGWQPATLVYDLLVPDRTPMSAEKGKS